MSSNAVDGIAARRLGLEPQSRVATEHHRRRGCQRELELVADPLPRGDTPSHRRPDPGTDLVAVVAGGEVALDLETIPTLVVEEEHHLATQVRVAVVGDDDCHSVLLSEQFAGTDEASQLAAERVGELDRVGK